jgi:alanine racemase
MTAVIHLDPTAAAENIAAIRRLIAPGAKVIAMLKANAYGHGLLPFAHLIRDAVDEIAITDLDDAHSLRADGIDIPLHLVGGEATGADLVTYTRLGVVPTAPSLAAARAWSRHTCWLGRAVPFALEFDGGLKRSGLNLDGDALNVVQAAAALPDLVLARVYMHLSMHTLREVHTRLTQFTSLMRGLNRGRQIGSHVLSSAGIAAGLSPAYPAHDVRPGILIYGHPPSYGLWPEVPVRPVLSLKSHVGNIIDVEPGAAVGYYGDTAAGGASRIGTIPVGFAAGVPQTLTNGGRVLLRGDYARINAVGMEHITFDIGPAGAEIGDEVVLLGAQGQRRIELSEWTAATGRLNSDLLVGLSPDIPRLITGPATTLCHP